jgi:hypothetical protein
MDEHMNYYSAEAQGEYNALSKLESFIDTLEVKEVDSNGVFIEKACEYFRRNLEDTKVIDDYRNILVRGIQASYTSVEEFIGDFKKYMEGE